MPINVGVKIDKMILLTDPHIYEDKYADYTEKKLPEIVTDYQLPIIGLGDFVEKNKMRTVPKELFGSSNIEYAVVIGNHDYEVYKKLPRGREMKRVFYENPIEKKIIRKFNENGFRINAKGIEELLDVRIYHTSTQYIDTYFLHIPPQKSVIRNLVNEAETNKVVIFCGHVHGIRNIRISNRWYMNKEVVEINLPTFLENHKLYLFEINGKEISLSEITMDVTTEELNYKEKRLPSRFGDFGVHYI